MTITIQQIMRSPVELIDPTTTIAAAAGKMRDEDLGCLLVGRNDRLLGMVTDRDLTVRSLAERRNAAREPVWTVMSTGLVCCFEDQAIEEAARLMAQHSIRRLPVLDQRKMVTGIVSLSDMHGGKPAKKPWQVTFYREFTDNRGAMHEVPLATMYVATPEREEAVASARRLLKEDWCHRRWKGRADGCRVVRGIKSRTFPPPRQSRAVRAGHSLNGKVRLPSHHEAGTESKQLSTG
jgi:CBS domain-containing protein